jgi:DNA-binding MarR family transcriptional regulator
MTHALHDLLGDLVSVNSRLTRVAAHAAGGSESPAVWRTLSVLRTSGPIRLGALATLSRVSQPTATKLVTALEQRGWVTKVSDPTDSRATQTAITAAGETALSDWRDQLATALFPLFSDLSAAELDTLRSATDILRARVERSEGTTLEEKP